MKHGTVSGYKKHKCGCQACVDANRRHVAAWRSRTGQTRKTPLGIPPAESFDWKRFAELGRIQQAHTQSRAQAIRREDRGETVERCPHCGCEVDVETPAHDRRCKREQA